MVGGVRMPAQRVVLAIVFGPITHERIYARCENRPVRPQHGTEAGKCSDGGR